MLNFIAEYWIEFAFGLIAAAITFCIRQYYASTAKLKQKDQEAFKKEIIDTINKDIEDQVTRSDNADKKIEGMVQDLTDNVHKLSVTVSSIQEQIVKDDAQALRSGVLSMQGKAFKADCRRLLEKTHEITEEEYEDIVADHETYHNLGGNHMGDSLFTSVMKKWNAQMEKSVKEEHNGSRNRKTDI